MKSYEMVETLSDKTKVSLAEAKEALENSNWDMLDAAIYIEKHKAQSRATQSQASNGNYAGSQQTEQNGRYSTPNYTHFSGAPNNQPFDNGQAYNQYGNQQNSGPFNVPPYNPQYNQPPVSIGEMLGKICGKLENLINKGFRGSFVVSKNGRRAVQIPILIFLIILLCGFWSLLPILLIGLFFGFSYSFEDNSNSTKEPLNDFFNNAKNAAGKMKDNFQASRENMKEEYDVLKKDFQKGKDSTKQ